MAECKPGLRFVAEAGILIGKVVVEVGFGSVRPSVIGQIRD